MPGKARLVVDASLAVDLFAARSRGHVEAAEAVFRCLSERGVQLYAPRLFLVEAADVLVRFLPPRLVGPSRIGCGRRSRSSATRFSTRRRWRPRWPRAPGEPTPTT